MVKGLDEFKDRFAAFNGRYILIGGAACDLLHEDAGLEFRVTNDLDIVLCLEALDREFAHAFWNFVRAGRYRRREKSSGRQEFFRFINPGDASFPQMLELFSRKPDTLSVPDDQQVVPIPPMKMPPAFLQYYLTTTTIILCRLAPKKSLVYRLLARIT